MLTAMTTEGQQLATAAGSADPAVGLRAVRALRELAERLEAGHVAKARETGWSWQEIADCIGVSRQAVHKKYGSSRRILGKGR
jgi:DNA-directed RNA polymerase specialized sigma24 family protein